MILSSMQVILSTKDVPAVFNDACFVFGVFAMVIILVGIALQVVLFVTLFLYYLVSTIINLEKKGVPWVFSRRR